jgi:hypothetical protein
MYTLEQQEGKRTYVFKKARIIFQHDLLVHVTYMTHTIEAMHNTTNNEKGSLTFRLELICRTESIVVYRCEERLLILGCCMFSVMFLSKDNNSEYS